MSSDPTGGAVPGSIAAIRSAMKQVPSLDPKAVEDAIIGCAMPEAEQGLNMARIAVLLAAGTKGKRLALPHSRILLHQPYGQVGYGQVTDLEIAAKEILRMRDLLEEILAKHTGQSMERIHADTDRDFVIEANEAVEYGIIDSVISSRELTDRSGPIR